MCVIWWEWKSKYHKDTFSKEGGLCLQMLKTTLTIVFIVTCYWYYIMLYLFLWTLWWPFNTPSLFDVYLSSNSSIEPSLLAISTSLLAICKHNISLVNVDFTCRHKIIGACECVSWFHMCSYFFGDTPIQMATTLNLANLGKLLLIGMSNNIVSRLFGGHVILMWMHEPMLLLLHQGDLVVLPWTRRIYGHMYIKFLVDFSAT